MLNRRDLLKLFGVSAGAAAIPSGIAKSITKIEGEEKKKLFEQIVSPALKVETPVEIPMDTVAAVNKPPAPPRGSLKLNGGSTRIDLHNCTITFRDSSGETIEVALGEGNITWTEHSNFEFSIDRGHLDTVRIGDEQPLDVTMDFMFEWFQSSTEKYKTPMDMLRETPINELDLIVSVDDEAYILIGFNWQTMEYDYDAATMSLFGICNMSQETRM